ncbi:unnamed protein product [Arabidopsis halleri]
MNVHSSRSHTIFRMVIESRGKDNSSSDTICVSVFCVTYLDATFLGKVLCRLTLSVILFKGGGRSSARETYGRVAPELWQENFEAFCRN